MLPPDCLPPIDKNINKKNIINSPSGATTYRILTQIDSDSLEWIRMTNLFKAYAAEMGIEIACGIDFKSLRDAPHIEIKNWRKIVKEI